MNIEWLSGFVSGEGCFTFVITKTASCPLFTMTLHIKDLDLLQKIQIFLKVGKIHVNKSPYNSCTLQVGGEDDCKKISILFDKRLKGSKELDFKIWKEGIEFTERTLLSREDKRQYLKKLRPSERRNI